MKKLALVGFVGSLLVITSCGGGGGGGSNIVPPPPKEWRVDGFVNLSAATVGDTITPTIITGGTAGSPCSWMPTQGTPAGLTVGASQGALGAPVAAGGTTFPTSFATHSIALDNSDSGTFIDCYLPAGHPVVTVAGYVTLNQPNHTDYTAGNYDLIRVDDNSGDFDVLLKLNPGNISAQQCYCLSIETGVNGLTRSDFLPVTPGARVLFNVQFNNLTGVAKLNFYDPNTLALLGSTTAAQSTGGDVLRILIGNAETGTDPGTSTFFEDVMIDFSNQQFPLMPS